MNVIQMCLHVFEYFQIPPENINDLDWTVFVKSGLKCVIFWHYYH